MANLSVYQGSSEGDQSDKDTITPQGLGSGLHDSAAASTIQPPQSLAERSKQLLSYLETALQREGKGSIDPWHRLAVEVDCRIRDCAFLEQVTP